MIQLKQFLVLVLEFSSSLEIGDEEPRENQILMILIILIQLHK